MSKINTKDATTNSVDSLRIKSATAGKRNSGAAIEQIPQTPKELLKNIKSQRKELNSLLKDLDRQEKTILKKQSAEKKSKKVVK